MNHSLKKWWLGQGNCFCSTYFCYVQTHVPDRLAATIRQNRPACYYFLTSRMRIMQELNPGTLDTRKQLNTTATYWKERRNKGRPLEIVSVPPLRALFESVTVYTEQLGTGYTMTTTGSYSSVFVLDRPSCWAADSLIDGPRCILYVQVYNSTRSDINSKENSKAINTVGTSALAPIGVTTLWVLFSPGLCLFSQPTSVPC